MADSDSGLRRPRNRPRRERLACVSIYEAAWEGAFEGYTKKYVHKNLWRLTRTCDFDDAMQEARIVFMRCARKYADRIDYAAWFMAVYKRSLMGRFADLATNDTRYRSTAQELTHEGDDGVRQHEEAVGELVNAGELACAVSGAPSEVREVLALLFGAPAELLDVARRAWGASRHKDPFGNAMINKLLGRAPAYPSLEEVREYFER